MHAHYDCTIVTQILFRKLSELGSTKLVYGVRLKRVTT